MVNDFLCNGLSFSLAGKIIFPVMEFHDFGCIILSLKKRYFSMLADGENRQ